MEKYIVISQYTRSEKDKGKVFCDMKKLISGVLASSILLGSGAVPAMAAEASAQTAAAPETKNAASVLLKNYSQYLAGSVEMNQNENVKAKLTAIEKDAEKAIAAYQGVKDPYHMFAGDAFDMSDEKTVKAEPGNSNAFNKNAQYLFDMALAYATSGSKYYKDAELQKKIVEAVDAFYNVYNKHTSFKAADGRLFGNWWNWEIGVPTEMTGVLALMQEELQKHDPKMIANFVKMFDNHLRCGKNGDIDLKSAMHTGTNLIDITTNRIIQGALINDTKRIEKAVKDMLTVFVPIDPYHIVNNNTDGVYADGSFIQHHRVAYTGSYGKLMLQKAVSSLYILQDTVWQPKEQVATIENWIYKSFLPLIHEGYMSEVVKGRAVSRTNTGYSDTAGVVEAMTLLTTFLPEENSKKMQQQIKHFVKSMPVAFSASSLNLPAIAPFNAIMNDEKIQPASVTPKGSIAFNAMDRNLQRADGFTFALSRSSDRIAKYEYMSGENLRPWFQGDGAFYLYLSGVDQTKQYGINYFSTVDPLRLPGTTVPNESRKTVMELYDGSFTYPKYGPSSVEQNDYVYFPVGTNTFSGSVAMQDGSVSMAGMQLGDENAYAAKKAGKLPEDFVTYKNATGNKSWFMMEDKIVFMGSNIGDTDKRDVTTTIDNRMMAVDAKPHITAQGRDGKALTIKEGTFDPQWLAYQDDSIKAKVGYYFPESKEIKIATPTIKGEQKNVRNVANQKEYPVTQKYFTMTYEHGKQAEDAYSYVMLPNATAESMKQYAAKPDIKILENSKSIHAVQDTEGQVTAVNFFEAGKAAGIKASKPASVLMKQADGKITVALSDPLFRQDSIELVLDIPNAKIVSKDEKIQATANKDTVQLKCNTKQLYGKSLEITLEAQA